LLLGSPGVLFLEPGEKVMKRQFLAIAIISLAAAAPLLLIAANAPAQQDEIQTDSAVQSNDNENNRGRDASSGRSGSSANRSRGIGKLDEQTSGANIRASQLIGMNIQNDRGDNVGQVNDLVIDGNSGRVRYAAVTYGGFLGVGGKMFAVPFEAFKVQQDADDRDEHVLVLNVTQEQLEGAEGFDEENWPDFANRQFTEDLDRRYKVDRNRSRDRSRNDR
jgi:sporulation protein YlmC with PRC-barrel domain